MGDKTLIVRRANEGATQFKPELEHALQQITLQGYNPSHQAAVELTPESAGGLEGPFCIFVGGLPYHFTEAQIRDLLESFGPLQGFHLVKDRDTGNSKGSAFCVYQDLSVTDIAVCSLKGLKIGDKTLVVRRANECATQLKPEQDYALQQITLQGAPVNIRTPYDYKSSLAFSTLGRRESNPSLNLAAVELTLESAGVLEGPDCIFVGGLPYYLTETPIRELLKSFGSLWGFDLVRDRETGNSKG
ncbi:splicing factor U2af large subunit B-like [Cornus florida]|uniref:splicing factor U2af large subunit B-like n=1 Tax=Cornus florida TaxID=4283 RepID=UPI0028971595|nr:splicing factor U2af large subunit B-like [Cornus florida]XP_059644538.1 splicing factor U2af large subunit B-like [Cornus florida]XP_059644539.1 splicing factor U2af large subunit B-like [Cornus florida]XP_059644540.1 splicing factor U2af large subunit B-like [Cornus florida]XP_059644541.1 splicing factor U2af large subunit B-like [Cornus florida]